MEKYTLIFTMLSLAHIIRSCDEKSIIYKTPGRKFSSYKEGDYFIESLMSITKGEPCTEITTGGLLRLHAVKFAIKTRTRFTNVTLGYHIDDTCFSVPITMSRGIELTNEQRQKSCMEDHSDTCHASGNLNRDNKLLAVIGGYYSSTTIPLASLLGVYSIPQLSFGASTPLLNKRSDFPSSFRTIPSDEFTVEAMLAVIKHFKWSYIFAIGSKDSYGKLGLSILKRRANEEGVCITGDVYLPFQPEMGEMNATEIAKKIQKEDKAKTVVMFNYILGMGEYIIEEADKLGLERIWLTIEAWNHDVLTSTRIPTRQLSSIITISLECGQPLPSFLNYIQDVVRTDYKCDIWLHEYIKQKYNCNVESINNDMLHGIKASGNTNASKECQVDTKNVSSTILKDNPAQINGLIDTVDSIINAAQNIISSRCSNSNACNDILPEDITEALRNISFTTRTGSRFSYDINGNPSVVLYYIEQIQMNYTTKEFEYSILGSWSDTDIIKLKLDDKKFIPPQWTYGVLPNSTCSVDCLPGEHRIGVHGCCWKCQTCPEASITNETNQDKCTPCPAGHHTVTNTNCVRTPIIYLGANHPIGIATITFSVTGIAAAIICAILILIYRDTQTIKNWSQITITTSLILVVITFSYTFAHILQPTSVSCRVQHILFYMIMTSFSTTLILKENSLTRFLSKAISNDKYERLYEILICFCTLIVEIALVITWQWEENFPINKAFSNYEYYETCELNFSILHLICFGYPSLILLISLILNLSDKHSFDENKDLKYLHYTCLAFCIINVAYIVTVNHVVGIYKAMVTLCTTLAYGYIYIGCMIVTKLFDAIIEQPDSQVGGKNNNAFDENHR